MTLLLITGLLAVLAIGLAVLRIRGKSPMAINAGLVGDPPESVPAESLVDPATGQPAALPGAVVTVGLPKGLDTEKVRQRKIALMSAGTEALLAEKLAIDAETQQLQRDKHLTAEVKLKEVPVTAKVPTVETHPEPKTGKKS